MHPATFLRLFDLRKKHTHLPIYCFREEESLFQEVIRQFKLQRSGWAWGAASAFKKQGQVINTTIIQNQVISILYES